MHIMNYYNALYPLKTLYNALYIKALSKVLPVVLLNVVFIYLSIRPSVRPFIQPTNQPSGIVGFILFCHYFTRIKSIQMSDVWLYLMQQTLSIIVIKVV